MLLQERTPQLSTPTNPEGRTIVPVLRLIHRVDHCDKDAPFLDDLAVLLCPSLAHVGPERDFEPKHRTIQSHITINYCELRLAEDHDCYKGRFSSPHPPTPFPWFICSHTSMRRRTCNRKRRRNRPWHPRRRRNPQSHRRSASSALA